MLRTSDNPAKPHPAYRPNICIAVRKDGRACSSKTVPGSVRCAFHPESELFADIYAEAPASVDIQPRAADLIAAALSNEALDAPESFRLPEDVSESEEWRANMRSESVRSEAESVPQAPDPQTAEGKNVPKDTLPAGQEWQYKLNAAGDDYERISVPLGTPSISVREQSGSFDDTDLGRAYHAGQNADFDYRWMHEDKQKNLIDRKNGFVPVKTALNDRFPVVNGVVTFGDLVLARRPKSVTEQRALEVMRTHERMNNVVDEFKSEAAHNPNVGTFGAITTEAETLRGSMEARGNMDAEELRDSRRRSEEMKPAPRGRKTFAIPSMPWQRDKVAERHGSVGGS